MASLLPQSTQRNASTDARHQAEGTLDSQAAPRPTSSTATETSSPDVVSTTPFLWNGATADSHEPPTNEAQAQEPSALGTAVFAPDDEVAEPRKCWICFSDETEDSPLSSEWRSPCPCALTAHEACLLDWIADLQGPGRRKRSKAFPEIRCPQCKSKIIVVRPRNYIVDALDLLDRAAARAVVPGAVIAFSGCLWTGCLAYGMNTVHLVFGDEYTNRILADGESSTDLITGGAMTIARLMLPLKSGWSWRLGLGLPLIPVVLILARTTLADSVLPILPIIFLATHVKEGEHLDVAQWPPSAAMTVAALPYIRGAYNELYERAFGERLRKWAKEVQPRPGEGEQEEHDHDHGLEPVQGIEIRAEDVLMEIDVEIDIVQGNGEDEEAQQPDPAPGLGMRAGQDDDHAAAAPPGGNQANAQNPPPAAAAAAAQQPPAQVQRANSLVLSTGTIAETIIGALLFPAISSAMGSILKRVLPRTWTTPPGATDRRGSGLLQSKWGRSIVGGCLFVVLKDAVVLYARWKEAQIHRQRRVLNHDKSKGRRSR